MAYYVSQTGIANLAAAKATEHPRAVEKYRTSIPAVEKVANGL